MNPIPEGTNLNDKKQFVKTINNMSQEQLNNLMQDNQKMDQLSNMMAMMTKQFEGKSQEEMMKEYQKLMEKVSQQNNEKK